MDVGRCVYGGRGGQKRDATFSPNVPTGRLTIRVDKLLHISHERLCLCSATELGLVLFGLVYTPPPPTPWIHTIPWMATPPTLLSIRAGERAREQAAAAPRARVGVAAEAGLDESFIPPLIAPAVPSRWYFLFGRPVATTPDMYRDRAACDKVGGGGERAGRGGARAGCGLRGLEVRARGARVLGCAGARAGCWCGGW